MKPLTIITTFTVVTLFLFVLSLPATADQIEAVLFKEVCSSLEKDYPDLDCRYVFRPEVIYTRLVGIAGPYAGIYIRGEKRIYVQWPPSFGMQTLRTVKHEFAHYIIVTEELLPPDANRCAHEAAVRKAIGQPWGEKDRAPYGCGGALNTPKMGEGRL
jgi:hypothetical protein